MGKRVVVLFTLFCLCMGSLSMRMLAISADSAVSSGAQSGNTLSAVVGETRGYIYDVNGEPLVNCETTLAVAIQPDVQALNAAGAVLQSEDKDALFETVSDGKIAVAEYDFKKCKRRIEGAVRRRCHGQTFGRRGAGIHTGKLQFSGGR